MARHGREVFRRVLLAVALGDALGLPYELAERPTRITEDELHGIVVSGRYAYSDDTELTLLLAESLIENCGFSPKAFALKLAEKANIENPVRNYGAGTAEVIFSMRRGVPWWIAARRVYNGEGNYGNGAAIRVAPIPLFYETREAVELMAIAQSMVTHTHPLGVEASRLQALAIHLLLEGANPEELPSLLAREAIYEEFRSRLTVIGELVELSPADASRIIGNGVAGFESVPAAVYAFVKAEGDPLETLLIALNMGGDTDSIASMAMALAAAHSPNKGWEKLEKHIELLEGKEEIITIADKLYEAYLRCRAISK